MIVSFVCDRTLRLVCVCARVCQHAPYILYSCRMGIIINNINADDRINNNVCSGACVSTDMYVPVL